MDLSMEIDRNAFIDSLQANGNLAEAAQAQLDLPAIIDSTVASDWLAGVGIDPQEILNGLPIAEGQEWLSGVSEADPRDLISDVTGGGGIGEMISNFFSRFTGR